MESALDSGEVVEYVWLIGNWQNTGLNGRSSMCSRGRRCDVLPAWLMLVLALAASQTAHGAALFWDESPLPLRDIEFVQVASSGATLLASARSVDEPSSPTMLFTSNDGLDWTLIDPGLAGRAIDAVGFALDRFVVVLNDGHLLVGDDAASWSALPGPVDRRLKEISLLEHSGRIWLLARWDLGDLATVGLISSADFAEWTVEYSTESSGTFVPSLRGLAAGGGTFAATWFPPPPTGPTLRLTVALNEDDWLFASPRGPAVASRQVVWNGSAFMAIASQNGSSTALGLVRGTPDGVFDFVVRPGHVGRFSSLRGGPDGLILQQSGGANRLLTSSNGIEWFAQPAIPTGTFRDFVRWQGGWVGVGTTTIRGLPAQARPVPALSLSGLITVSLGLVLAGAFAVIRNGSRSC